MPSVLAESQAKGYYEAIDWVCEQPWSNGNVGLCGVSFLSISQYHVAAHAGKLCGELIPRKGLKCIVPWKGLSDFYRDVACPGGVDDVGFLNFWWHTEVLPPLGHQPEKFIEVEGATPPDILKCHPLLDDFWKAKIPDLSQIRTDAGVCVVLRS